MSRTEQDPKEEDISSAPRGTVANKKAKKTHQADPSKALKASEEDNLPSQLIQAEPPKPSDYRDTSTVSMQPTAGAHQNKRDRDEFEADGEKQPTIVAAPAKKKKYKSKAERRAVATEPIVDNIAGAGDNWDSEIAHMDPSLLADHFAKTIERCYGKDTTLELDKKYLPSATFMDMSSHKESRKKGMLSSFLADVVGGDRSKLTHAAKETARPHTILLCQSGIRAADLARVLRTLETEGNAVVKLFAKHFKIDQQAVFLRKNKVGFGVGTPQRIKELISMGGLKLDNLARIVIDGSYLDEKQYGIWGYADVFKAMLDLLHMKEVQGRINAAHLKVAVF